MHPPCSFSFFVFVTISVHSLSIGFVLGLWKRTALLDVQNVLRASKEICAERGEISTMSHSEERRICPGLTKEVVQTTNRGADDVFCRKTARPSTSNGPVHLHDPHQNVQRGDEDERDRQNDDESEDDQQEKRHDDPCE